MALFTRPQGDEWRSTISVDNTLVLVGFCADPPLGRFAIPPCDNGYSPETIAMTGDPRPFNRAVDLFAIGDALVMLPAEF